MTTNYFWKGGLGGNVVGHHFASEPCYVGFHIDDLPELAMRINAHDALVAALQALLDDRRARARVWGISPESDALVIAARSAIEATQTPRPAVAKADCG